MSEPFPKVFKRPFIGLLSEKLTFEALKGALNFIYNSSDFENEYDILNQHTQFYRSIITLGGTRIRFFFVTFEGTSGVKTPNIIE